MNQNQNFNQNALKIEIKIDIYFTLTDYSPSKNSIRVTRIVKLQKKNPLKNLQMKWFNSKLYKWEIKLVGVSHLWNQQLDHKRRKGHFFEKIQWSRFVASKLGTGRFFSVPYKIKILFIVIGFSMKLWWTMVTFLETSKVLSAIQRRRLHDKKQSKMTHIAFQKVFRRLCQPGQVSFGDNHRFEKVHTPRQH